MALVVTCWDGSSASIRDRLRRKRFYMSDTVLDVLDTIYGNYQIPAELKYMDARGGLLISHSCRMKQLKQFILEYNVFENTLFLVGKSYGAKNTVDLLLDIQDHLIYKTIYLFLVDACWIGKILNPNAKIEIPMCVTEFSNFWQHNNKFLNGAGTISNSVSKGKSLQICYGHINHWNIITCNTVIYDLTMAIQKLLGVN